MLLLGLLVGAVLSWYTWSQSQYFVGTSATSTGDVVAVYRGPSEPLFGFDLSRLVETSSISVSELPEFEQEQVASTIAASGLTDAREIVDRLQTEMQSCTQKNPPAGCPEAP
jgi:protein phosphatase